MGSALVQAFQKSNHRVTIWNRTADKPQVKEAINTGAVLQMNLAKAVEKNPIIACCLLDYTQINAVTSSLPQGAFRDKLFLNLTNGTPRQAWEMAQWARSQGVSRYFDGAAMVTPQMIGTPQSFLVVSGETETRFHEISPLLRAAGTPQYLGEEISSATRFDVAALALMYGMFNGAFVSLALLKRSGQDVRLGPIVQTQLVPFLTALVPYIGLIADSWDKQTWQDSLGSPMGMQNEAMRNTIQACAEEGIDSGPMDYFAQLMQRVVEDHGDDGGVAVLGTYLLK
jgi:3-hydroxyisobutyrate dehydrogenase-like beta-hydroxyacid dehydrogenase